jgi:hypothetical protein
MATFCHGSCHIREARGRVFGSGTMLQIRRSRVRFPTWSLHVFNILKLSYGHGIDSASKWNDYQEPPKMGVNDGQHVRL